MSSDGGSPGGSILPDVLVLHFDYPSAASAVAVLRLQRVADEGGTVRLAGLDVLGLDHAIPPPLDLLAEIARFGEQSRALGLPMRRPSRRPTTLAAHVIGDLADRRGLGAAWRWACLRAFWCDDADLGDDTVLMRLVRTVGLDTDAAQARLVDRDARLERRRQAIAQRRRGVGGVPMLELNGTLLAADLPHDRLLDLAAL